MEHIIPRKLTLVDRSEAEDAIPELVAFWNFLKREYNFRNAGAIATYLTQIEGKFTDWMFDPAKGGIAKNFFMSGIQAGFDMRSEEGRAAYQKAYNERILSEKPHNSFLEKLTSLLTTSSPEVPSTPQHSKQKLDKNTKGFKPSDKGKKK